MKQLYIGGEWSDGAAAISNINPSDTSDIIDEYAQADANQVGKAISSAKTAFASWSRSGIQQRHDILLKVADELFERREEIGNLLAREEGKTLAEGIGETIRASQVFRFFSGEALRQQGEHLESVRPGITIDITREPIGVVGIITPWNFPIAIPAWKIAPALCYGNTVVFKPAGIVPGCGWVIADILSRAGIPEGVFNLVMGSGSVVGEAILNSKDVNAVTFTGSVETGNLVAQACAKRMAKFQLEMGGKNPLVVLDDANLDIAVDCAVNGAFFSTGQRCTASSRLIVTAGIHEKFVEAMKKRMNDLVIDDARKEGTHIGPVVDERQMKQDIEYIDVGKSEGAVLELGGEVVTRETNGYYLTPALFTNASPNMRIAREEIFGPVASVIKVKDYDEALTVANDCDFGLSAGICTTSLKYSTDFKRNSDAGMVMVNLPTAGVDYHVPFGGRKGSSYGAREQGTYAEEFYTTVKTAYQQA